METQLKDHYRKCVKKRDNPGCPGREKPDAPGTCGHELSFAL